MTSSQAGPRPEIVSLTGLRAFAALWVVAHHHRVFVEGELAAPFAGMLERGYLGVDVFFTLSGFVLAYNYGGRLKSGADHVRFLVLRIARLYPLHLATFLGLAGLATLAPLLGVEPGSPERYVFDRHFVLHLFMVHAWGFEDSLRFNQPSWSVSAEFFAYLCFPLAWAIVSRARGAAVSAAGAGAACAAVILALRALGYDGLHVPTGHALVRVAGEFLAGCFVFRAVEQGGPRLGAAATAVALAALVGLALSPWGDPWMAPGASLLVYVLAQGSGGALKAFTAPAVRYLGKISYSIYLTHMPVLALLHRILPSWELGALPWLPTLAILAAHTVVILGVAAASYRWIEAPAREAIRNRLDLRRTP